MAPLNILIVGCSVAGPTLASFLMLSPVPASEKPRVTILERSPALRYHGQNIDIRGAGVDVVRKLGLEAAVRASTTGEEGVRHVDKDDCTWISVPADKTGKLQTPTSDIEILRGRLAELCYQRSRSISEDVQKEGGAGAEYIFGDTIDELEQDGDGVRVRFAKSGERRTFDLVVGADGLGSRTRKLAWGAEGEADRVHRLGMYAAFFSMPRAETDTMWRRWFRAPGRRSIMLRPDVQRNKTTALLSIITDEDPRFLDLALKGHEAVGAQKQVMKEHFENIGWESDRVIKEMMASEDFYFDMVAQVKMEKWTKGRVVLIGDAGYCASYLSGMGTTLALNGAYNLAGALLRHPQDLAAAFQEYEATMRPLVDRAQKLAPGMPRAMSPETAWGIWTLHALFYSLHWTGLIYILFLLKGPPARAIPVPEYGFKELPEWDFQPKGGKA